MIANCEDFCLMCYVAIADGDRALPASVKPRGMARACRDSEVLTMAVVAECMGWDAETEAISRWRAHRALCPHQPERTRCNRRRALADALTLIRRRIRARTDYARDRQCVIASLPVPVLGCPLVPGATGAGYWRSYGADDGRVASKQRTIFGYQLPLLTTLGGVIRDFVLAPASAHDVAAAPDLLDATRDLVVIGDKGYTAAPLAQALRAERGVTLATPMRRNQQVARDPAFARLLNGMRQVIETVNDQLVEQFNIGRNDAHTFGGVCACIERKVTAHPLCIHLNRPLAKADALQIKALAFPIN